MPIVKNDRLQVWLDDVHVANLTTRQREWQVYCEYTDVALDRWSGNAPVLSCSLPLQRKRVDASTFFDGLLPEGQHRDALAREIRVPSNYTFSLLERFGRDVAGALIISQDRPTKRKWAVERYTSSSLEDEVVNLPDRPLAIYDDTELSLAGLQDKLLLVDDDGVWARPIHGQPSTHILKLDDRRRPGLVQAEAQCLALAGALGLTDIEPVVKTISDIDCLIVARYDRKIVKRSVVRIHQEDACQALRLDAQAAHGKGKYESSGGPSFRAMAKLIAEYATDSVGELDRLVEMLTFNTLIGNADAHGKNISFLHPDAETIALAPLYDTVPTALWPKLRKESAMSVAGKWRPTSITSDDIVAEARSWPHLGGRAEASALYVAEQLLQTLKDDVIDPDSPVAHYVRSRSESFLATHAR
jgi:serine/threonine-protein kinase HipA